MDIYGQPVSRKNLFSQSAFPSDPLDWTQELMTTGSKLPKNWKWCKISTGWWFFATPLKNMVHWDDYFILFPIYGKMKVMFQSPPTSLRKPGPFILWLLPLNLGCPWNRLEALPRTTSSATSACFPLLLRRSQCCGEPTAPDRCLGAKRQKPLRGTKNPGVYNWL